jgi:hypothetical protein
MTSDAVRLVGHSDGHSASLSFSGSEFGRDNDWMDCLVELASNDRRTEVAVTMIRPYREDTIVFFEKLASKPDTWLGSAIWYAESAEITIEAQGQGTGLVMLRVELRRYAHEDPASTASLVITYGALRDFARALGEFMRIPAAPPGWKTPRTSQLARWSFSDAG